MTPFPWFADYAQRSVDVYDIQVEGNHNFFANQVLTHNCVIIATRLNAMDAYSDKKRSKANRWLMKRPRIVHRPARGVHRHIMQRLHAAICRARLRSGTYEHLCLRRVFEPKRKYQTSVGTDWRTEPGELLFPELFTPDVMDAKRYAWASSLCGSAPTVPPPAAGTCLAPRCCASRGSGLQTYTFGDVVTCGMPCRIGTKNVCAKPIFHSTPRPRENQKRLHGGLSERVHRRRLCLRAAACPARMQIPEVTRTID
jgi:hypothetical protein